MHVNAKFYAKCPPWDENTLIMANDFENKK
jgi:hypothetical protein